MSPAAHLRAGPLQFHGPLEVFRGDRETVRQLAVVPPKLGPERAADVQQDAAGDDLRRGGLDAGHQVAFGGDHVPGGAAVPGLALVEDVAQAVPLRGALQRHGNDVVRAAEAVREALVAAFGVHAGVGHGVHRVGAAAPALLRPVGVERLGQREGLARLHQGGRFDALGGVDEVQGSQDVIVAPAAPVVVGCGHGADAAERVLTPDHRGISGG